MADNDDKNSRENKENNGEKTVQERGDKRGENGRFALGNPGGPGRGKKKANDDLQLAEDLLELVESVAREGITVSQDLKDKLNAAKLGLNVAKLKKPDEGTDPLHPVILGWLQMIEDLAEVGDSGWDVMKRMIEICPDCDKICSKRFNVDLGPI